MPLTTSILGRLKTQQETVQDLVKGLSEDQLKQRVNPEKWSAFEQIAHLVAYQPTFLKRLQLITHQETPVFERYLADNDPLFHQCLGYSLKQLLEDLSTHRFLISNHITQLSETSLRREGVHPLYGSFTTSQWVEFFLLHEAHHLFAIFMLTAAVKNSVQ